MNYYNQYGNSVPIWFEDRLELKPYLKGSILSRDNHRCRICGDTNNLHIHHIRKRRDGGTNDSDNLITLCNSCHRHIETGDVEHAKRMCNKKCKKQKLYTKEEDSHRKIEDASKSLNELFTILGNSGDTVNTTSMKIYIDEILDKLE